MAPSIIDQVQVEKLKDGEFVSKSYPIRLGNALPIAYGGATAAVAVRSALETVPAQYSLYSVLGHFLGPASTDKKLYCSVQETRNTRSFATRRVQVKQKQDDGSFRTCLELAADFHIVGPALFEYSAPSKVAWPRPEACPEAMEHARDLGRKGEATAAQVEQFITALGPGSEYFETRYCVDGVSAQNLSGGIKGKATSQDQLPVTAKTSAEWTRTYLPVTAAHDNISILSFLMDGALSFLPLSHTSMWFDDSSACSTLDFALRVFSPEVKMDEWHLRERITSHARSGLSYSEGRLWDDKGNLVASMTQQSILRPNKNAIVTRL